MSHRVRITSLTMVNYIYSIFCSLFLLTLSLLPLEATIEHASAQSRRMHISVRPQEEREIVEREKFFRDRLLSNEIKDPDLIERLSCSSWNSMPRSTAFSENAVAAWQEIGSGISNTTASGRVRSIAFDPTNSRSVYIAATVGGLWHTDNIYADPVQWEPLSDQLPASVCTQVVIPKQQPKTIYVGTGETVAGWTASPGRGVFKSMDGGLNWKNVLSSDRMGSTCSQLVVDPVDPAVLFAAGPGEYYAYQKNIDTATVCGLFKTTDGGSHWSKIDLGPRFYPACVAIDPSDHHRIYVTGYHGEVSRSLDGGLTWLKCNVPFASSACNPMIAIAPTAPDRLYLIAADPTTMNAAGIFSSSDFGATWTMVNTADDPTPGYPTSEFLNGQGEYASAIVVDSNDSRTIYVGGRDVYGSSDGGQTLTQMSVWWANPTDTSYSHADIHALQMHDGKLFCGNDGGISFFTDNSWHNSANLHLPTLEFIGVDADRDLTYIAGGAQDNGTSICSMQDQNWYATNGGDGGVTWISPLNSARVFGTYIGTAIYRSDDSGATWSSWLATNQDLQNESAPFYAAYDASPDGNIVAFGGNQHVYVSLDGGNDGFAIEGTPVIGVSRCIRVSTRDPRTMWAGTTGTLYSSTDQGANWQQLSLSASGNVVGIMVGATDSELYVVFAGLSADSNQRFAKSTDAGATWTMPAKNLPNVPLHTLARSASGGLYAGTNQGVIASTDGGITWEPFGLGLPRVQVLSLKVKGANDEYLLAGTHGRGAYSIKLEPLGVSVHLQPSFKVDEIFPNPATAENKVVRFGMSFEHKRNASITLYDAEGRLVRVLAQGAFTVNHHAMTLETNDLPSGVYYIAIASEGEVVNKKFTIIR